MVEQVKSSGKADIAKKEAKHVESRQEIPGVELTITSRHGITTKSAEFKMTPVDKSSPIAALIDRLVAAEKEEEPPKDAWIRQIGTAAADQLEAAGLPRIPTLYDGNWYCFDADGNWSVEPEDFDIEDGELKKNGWVICCSGINDFLRMQGYSELDELMLCIRIITRVDNLLLDYITPEQSVQFAYKLGWDQCVLARLRAENARVASAAQSWKKPWAVKLAEMLIRKEAGANSPVHWKMIDAFPEVANDGQVWEVRREGEGKHGELIAELVSGDDESAVVPETVKYNTFRRYLAEARERDGGSDDRT